MRTDQKCSLSRAAILLALLGACGCDAGTAQEGPVPVRHREGTLHGFLLLRTLAGDTLGHGDLLQVHRDSVIESRVSFLLRDGSRYEETVAFTQDSVFRIRRYHLLQRGPAFPADAEYTIDGTGHYRVESQGREDARPEVEEGRPDLPADVSNGLIPILVKNLEGGCSRERSLH